MLLVDALDERSVVVVLAGLHVEDDVHACLVECHGVEGGEDAVVLQLHGLRRCHAVAVDGHVVHHGNVDDALALTEVVVYGLCSCSHRLQEAVLILHVVPQPFHHLLIACRVDVRLAVGRCHADARVLQHTAQAAHRVSLEVCEVDHEVVVLQVRAHDVVLDVRGVLHGDVELTLLVHQVHLEAGCEAVLLDGLPMSLEGVAAAFVGGVALHDGAVHLVHQQSDELRLQVVRVARLAGGNLHGYASLGFAAQCLVDLHQRLRRDVARHVDGGLARLGRVGSVSAFCRLLVLCACCQENGCQKQRHCE